MNCVPSLLDAVLVGMLSCEAAPRFARLVMQPEAINRGRR